MTKHLLFLATGALALTACTSEEMINDVKSSSSNVIKFENVVNKTTRADLTSETLKHFNVFGFYTLPSNDKHAHQVFYNTDVNKDDDGNWDYATTSGERYWVPGAKYYFYAYSCDNKIISDELSHGIDYELNMDNTNEGMDASARVLELQNYVCDNVHQHDLVFASNTTGMVGQEQGQNQNVALQFAHILSKIKAKFTTKFPTEYQIVISDLTIENICDKGNYDPVSKWHSVGKTENAKALILPTTGDEFMIYNSGETTPISIATEPVYVIPNNSEVALKFTIDVYIGEDRSEKVMSKTLTGKFTPTWQPGYQYVYNVDINGNTTKMDVIVFTTEVNEFGDPEDVSEPTEFEVEINDVNN